MKRILLLLLAATLFAANSNAQLKPPTITYRDTLFIVACQYNEQALMEVNDFPCRIIEETPNRMYIAGNIYEKNKATSVLYKFHNDIYDSDFTRYVFADASVNGVKAKIVKMVSNSDSPTVIIIEIDSYRFHCASIKDAAKVLNTDEGMIRLLISGL